VVLPDVQRFSSPALAVVEKEIHKRLTTSRLNPAEIELIEAPDRRAEVDAVARRIRALWREGVRLREMSVLVRDLDVYHDLIAASFREHEIEFFADRRRQVGHHPLLQFIRACLFDRALILASRCGDDGDQVRPLGLSDQDADDWKTTCWSIACAAQPGQRKSPGTTPAKCSPEDESSAESLRADRIDPLRRQLAAQLTPFIEKISAKDLTLRQIVLHVFRNARHI